MKRLVLLVLLGSITACGDKSSPVTPSAATTQTRVIAIEGGSVDFGRVTLGSSFDRTIRIFNYGNATLTLSGLSGPHASVMKTIGANTSIPAGGSSVVTITFTPPAAQTYSGTLTVNSDATSGTNTIVFSGVGTLDGVPVFIQNGVGDSTFTVPSHVTRMRIDATYGGTCQNFIVRISTTSSSLVNVIIGTCSVADTRSPFSGTYAINNGGTVTIVSSTGVSWVFTEAR